MNIIIETFNDIKSKYNISFMFIDKLSILFCHYSFVTKDNNGMIFNLINKDAITSITIFSNFTYRNGRIITKIIKNKLLKW